MPNYVRSILLMLLVLLLTGCSTTKFVPQDKYLLNKMHVKVTDRREVNQIHHDNPTAPDADELASKMKSYVRQKNNSEIFGFWKLQLQVYSLAGPDSSKWVNRTLWKMGEAPEIFDPMLAEVSMHQIQQGLHNKGFFNGTVDTTMQVKKRRLKLTYNVTAGIPYTLNGYKVDLPQEDLQRYATNERRTLVHDGMVFDASVLDSERDRITRSMRRHGYYYFEKDYLTFVADSAMKTNEVSLEMHLADYVTAAPDSMRNRLFTRYRIRQVHFYTDFDPKYMPDSLPHLTVIDGAYTYTHAGRRLLRRAVLQRNCHITPGEYYNVADVERSYASLNALGPVKYVDISFSEVGGDSLDCYVVLSRGKLNSVSAEIEGTYSAGDWGIAVGAGYSNRNLFRGAEELNINGYCSYEWRQSGGRALEAKAEASIQFTNAPKVSIGYRYQNRPDEFTRTVANASLSYSYRGYNKKLRHQFNFVDISYVYLPWISDEFRDRFMQPTNLLRYSYENHFIVDWSYGGTYSSFSQRNPYRSYTNLSYQVETAGNLLYGISSLAHLPTDEEDGAYKVFNIRFAQYAKADLSVAYHQIFNPNHRLVYHAALGVAVPYLNASSIPFEKRYFAGGANSVRGWMARSLGPGAYHSDIERDYNNQVGDIKLDLNLEYRWHVWSVLELAAFTDAGNIWTIRDYETQPHGVFHLNEFYKQIAWSYGVGVRLDFSFFVFRVDFGVKLYDPSRLYYDNRMWRTAPNGLCWKDDMTFHFAIGHPF